MTHEGLNKYIEHYLDKDKTQSAIMLTGAWGSGKSYYIKKTLKPYLKKKGKDCVVVSLYGIKDLKEISKAIYLELRSIKIFKPNEATETAKIIGKTVLKNAVQFIPMLKIDTKVSKRNLEKLYESVNLSGKLIVFEDIERSHVDIIEFLGYVNNFVEQDSVKVLLVANEGEILKKGMPIESENEEERTSIAELLENRWRSDDDEQEVTQLSDTVKKYILVKEKTISDTIQYENDYKKAITSILKSFEFEYFNEIADTEDVNRILGIVKTNKGNLRTFIFACQKTKDIIERLSERDKGLFNHIFFSIIYFSYKYKKDNKIKWDGDSNMSMTLGSEPFPLFKSCYEHIVNHYVSEEKLMEIKVRYKDFKLYNEEALSNEDVNILFQYRVQTEEQLLKSIDNIEKGLEQNNIPLSIYDRLARTLIIVSEILEIKIEKIKTLLIGNLKGKEEEIKKREQWLFYRDDMYDKNDMPDEYIALKKKMIESLIYKEHDNWWGFDYNTKNLDNFYMLAIQDSGLFLKDKNFIMNADMDKIIKLINECDATQIQKLSRMFSRIYDGDNISEYYLQDKNKLKELQRRILKMIENDKNLDKIIRLHLSEFLDNLKGIIEKLEGN